MIVCLSQILLVQSYFHPVISPSSNSNTNSTNTKPYNNMTTTKKDRKMKMAEAH